MRKLLIVLLMVLLVFGCHKKDTFDGVIETFRGLGEEVYKDTEYEGAGLTMIFTDGYLSVADESTIMLYVGDESRVFLVEMDYRKKFLSNVIVITYADAMYQDEKEKKYANITFYGEEYDTGMNLEEYLKMLSEVRIDDVYEFFWETGYIEKD